MTATAAWPIFEAALTPRPGSHEGRQLERLQPV